MIGFHLFAILGRIMPYIFIHFLFSFVLLFCVVLSKSVISLRKNNQRINHRHRPHKPAV